MAITQTTKRGGGVPVVSMELQILGSLGLAWVGS